MTASEWASDASPWTWLCGDLHTHCEDTAQIGNYVDRIDPRLDFVALTNHGQKPVFFEQHLMVADLRQKWQSGLVLSGVEWNAPEGGHACVVFPPHANEAEHAYALSRGFDRHLEGAKPDISGGLALLAQLPAEQRPVLCFNHPAPGQWPAGTIATYRDRAVDGLVMGLETVHGHQGYDAGTCWDLKTYPGCAPGGLADMAYAAGLPFSLLAHSDFHIHKQDRLFDYGPGVFNHTLVGVPASDHSAEAIFTALRAGRTCAAQGHWLRLEEMNVGNADTRARIGDSWQGDGAQAFVEFDSTDEIDSVDWIGTFDQQSATIIETVANLPAGRHRLQLPIPDGARGFLRLRVLSASQQRPAPGPQAPKGFFTSAILLNSPTA
jgi:hypothetical protein